MNFIRKDWLSRIIIESDLLKSDFLSETEKALVLQYVFNKKEASEIALEFNLSDHRVRQILNESVNKIILRIDELIFRSKYLDKLIIEKENIELENRKLKVKFKNYLKLESQFTMDFESGNESIEILKFSVRAKRVLEELNVRKVHDLASLTINDLNNKRQVGRKTIAEIVSKCQEYGIKII